MSITPAQCRAARGLLGMSQAALCRKAKISRPTLINFESGKQPATDKTASAVLAVLTEAGVLFVDKAGHIGQPPARAKRNLKR